MRAPSPPLLLSAGGWSSAAMKLGKEADMGHPRGLKNCTPSSEPKARTSRSPPSRNQVRALADAGELDALRSDDGETRYRRCASADHHHLVCRVCGTAVDFEGPQVERWATKSGQEHGFPDVTHTVEITGTCPDCALPSQRRSRSRRAGVRRLLNSGLRHDGTSATWGRRSGIRRSRGGGQIAARVSCPARQRSDRLGPPGRP